MRKAQSMSVSVIVAAAIALLVLVVLALIFTGRISFTNQQIGDCENKGGSCFPDFCPEGLTPYSAWKCPVENSVCCIAIE